MSSPLAVMREAERELASIFAAFSDRLARVLARRRKGDFYSPAAQRALLKDVSFALQAFQRAYTRETERRARQIARKAANAARADLGRLAKGSSKEAYAAADRVSLAGCATAKTYIDAQLGRTLADLRGIARRDALAVTRRARAEGLTRKQAADALRLGFTDPELYFVDRRGRRWGIGAYFEILASTTLTDIWREAYVDAVTAAGWDVAEIVSDGKEPTDACAKWEGKSISLTGATPGLPTYAEAKASGEVFHPRCRHFLRVEAQ